MTCKYAIYCVAVDRDIIDMFYDGRTVDIFRMPCVFRACQIKYYHVIPYYTILYHIIPYHTITMIH